MASPYLIAITAGLKLLPHALDALGNVLSRDRNDKATKAEFDKALDDFKAKFEEVFDEFQKEFESLEERVGELNQEIVELGKQRELQQKKLAGLQRIIAVLCVVTAGCLIGVVLVLTHVVR
jgi:hypothetical protein